MRFFTQELLNRYGSDDSEVWLKASDDWETARGEYQKYLDSIYNHLSPSIRKVVNGYCFHDAEIFIYHYSLAVDQPFLLCVKPERPDDKEKIIAFKTGVQPVWHIGPTVGRRYWAYEELEMISENNFKLSILLDNDSVLQIPFVGDIKVYELV